MLFGPDEDSIDDIQFSDVKTLNLSVSELFTK